MQSNDTQESTRERRMPGLRGSIENDEERNFTIRTILGSKITESGGI
jgi:hypothetical protein